MTPTEQLGGIVNDMGTDFLAVVFAALPAIFKVFVICAGIGLVASLILFVLKGLRN